MLLTFAAMWLFGVPATVMSLGGIAIALGMAVDADLVALEACHRRLETRRRARAGDRRGGASSPRPAAFAPAILTSLLIAALAFLPVFAFGGETGRLLRPLALTKTLVVARGRAGHADAGARRCAIGCSGAASSRSCATR